MQVCVCITVALVFGTHLPVLLKCGVSPASTSRQCKRPQSFRTIHWSASVVLAAPVLPAPPELNSGHAERLAAA